MPGRVKYSDLKYLAFSDFKSEKYLLLDFKIQKSRVCAIPDL
jgi:hypothetical protein